MKTIQMSKFVFLATVAFLSFTIGCSDSADLPSFDSPSPQNDDVSIMRSYFYPTPKTVKVNSVVNWVNLDYVAHNVTSDSSMFDSGNIPAYGSFSYQFTTKGTYTYHCDLYGNMNGTIVVE